MINFFEVLFFLKKNEKSNLEFMNTYIENNVF